jgi:hypothetical protein
MKPALRSHECSYNESTNGLGILCLDSNVRDVLDSRTSLTLRHMSIRQPYGRMFHVDFWYGDSGSHRKLKIVSSNIRMVI